MSLKKLFKKVKKILKYGAVGYNWHRISKNDIPKWAKNKLRAKYDFSTGGKPGYVVFVNGKNYKYKLVRAPEGNQGTKEIFYKKKKKEKVI